MFLITLSLKSIIYLSNRRYAAYFLSLTDYRLGSDPFFIDFDFKGRDLVSIFTDLSNLI